jgi:hypothetical protein
MRRPSHEERATLSRLRLAALLLVSVGAMGVGVGASGAARPASDSKKGKLAVTSSIAGGARLSGLVVWTASTTGATVTKVEFLIDGSVRWTDTSAPYQYGGDPSGTLDTTRLANGAHTFAVKAYGANRRTSTIKASATVSNGPTTTTTPTQFVVTSTISDGATISGFVVWTATPSVSASEVEFSIDGVVKWTETAAPFQFGGDPDGTLDTTTLADGAHILAVTARSSDGQTATVSISASVSNSAAAPPPAYATIPRFGIATGYKILTRSPADQAFELDQIKAIGAKIVRFDSTPNNQAQVDAVVSGVLARGMEPMLILFGTTGPVSPSTAAAFAGDQAAKWKGRVRLYEFANEPDLNGWTGTSYAQSLIPVYDAIKAADPNAIVIAGALWKGAGGPVQFVTDMYSAGAKGHFDILSLHLYDDPLATGSWNIWNMAFHSTPSVRSVMDANGDTAIPIGATEAGGPVTSYGEDGQATIVSHDFEALSDPRLAFICVYAMMDDDVSGFGLLRPDRTRRPAWTIYQSRAT